MPDRGTPRPVPLPHLPDADAPHVVPLSRAELARLVALPASTTLVATVAPFALGARAGDWGTPAVEQLSGYAGCLAGGTLVLGGTALIEQLGGVPSPEMGVNRGALAFAAIGFPLLMPASGGAAVWWAGEGMQGRSRHPHENLFAAMGGGLAGELVYFGAAIAMKAPAESTLRFAYVPIALGATIAYDLARGPHRGPRRAEMPLLVVRF